MDEERQVESFRRGFTITNVKPSRLLFTILLCSALSQRGFGQSLAPAQETPLFALPYGPSLNPASMDRTIDPCTDFYRYSCSAWIKSNPIPADQSRWDVYAKLEADNERFLWGILQEAAKPTANRSVVETEIGDFFNACMDEAGD